MVHDRFHLVRFRKLPTLCYNLGLSMSRSGNTDLSVAITISDTIPEMLSVLLAVGAARWRRLCFRAEGEGFPAALSGLHYKRLQEVILSDTEECLGVDGEILVPFEAAPRLRRIRDSLDVYVALPLYKITYYDCRIFAIWKGTFAPMRNLTHLSLDVVITIAPIDKELAKLSFPKLLSLSLTLRSCTFFLALVRRLDAPDLADIRLTYQLDSDSKRKFSAFSLPITDILPKRLKSFHIACHGCKFIDADVAILASWLRLATELTALSVHLPSIHDVLLDYLHVHAQSDVLVPRLRSLYLWILDEDMQVSASKLLSVLESRAGSKESVSRLEEFCTNVDAGRFSEGRVQRWQGVCRKVKVFCPR